MHDVKTQIDCIKLAIDDARRGMNINDGGPFGAILVNENDHTEYIVAHNTVLKDKDPTAHAEINVIRNACAKYNTYDLSTVSDDNGVYKNFILYTTAYPCPMCLGAIKWANIKTIIYCADLDDTKKIGFRDLKMYDDFNNRITKGFDKRPKQLVPELAVELFEEYARDNKVIY